MVDGLLRRRSGVLLHFFSGEEWLTSPVTYYINRLNKINEVLIMELHKDNVRKLLEENDCATYINDIIRVGKNIRIK